MRNLRLMTCLFAIGLAALTGCQGTHEFGKSAKALFQGGVDTNVERSPEQIKTAVAATAADLKLIPIRSTTTKVKGKNDETVAILRTSQDTKIEITYSKVNDKVSTIEVNTGSFGDSTLRQRVYENLRVRLGVIGPQQQQPAPAQTEAAADWAKAADGSQD